MINYDFPISISDYLHRIGRVGRAGSETSGAKVTSLVCGKIGVAILQEIEKSVRLNKPIPEVESNIKAVFETYKSSTISRMVSNEPDQIMEE